MHTCARLGFDLKTPLGGPMKSQTIKNGHEFLCGHEWSMMRHKRGRIGMDEHMGEWEWIQEEINAQGDPTTTKYMNQHPWSNNFHNLRDGEHTKVWTIINEGTWVVKMIKVERLKEIMSPKPPID